MPAPVRPVPCRGGESPGTRPFDPGVVVSRAKKACQSSRHTRYVCLAVFSDKSTLGRMPARGWPVVSQRVTVSALTRASLWRSAIFRSDPRVARPSAFTVSLSSLNQAGLVPWSREPAAAHPVRRHLVESVDTRRREALAPQRSGTFHQASRVSRPVLRGVPSPPPNLVAAGRVVLHLLDSATLVLLVAALTRSGGHRLDLAVPSSTCSGRERPISCSPATR
jgi:hypothetical protein